MPQILIDRSEVIRSTTSLPPFPRIVSDIIETINEPDANLNELVRHVEHDPAIAARIMALANSASYVRQSRQVRDYFTAISLIGLSKVRELALIGALGNFFRSFSSETMPAAFWAHSIAVAVCAQELACHIDTPVSVDLALSSGLLHDIGELWLYRHYPGQWQSAWRQALASGEGIEETERQEFGNDHAAIGAWLGEAWGLPAILVAGIAQHHEPAQATDTVLPALIHVAEVLANALDLTERSENRVTRVSATACARLGMHWDGALRPLFGRIEARSRLASAYFL